MLNRKPDVAVGKSSCSQTTNGGSSGREVPDGRWRETKIMAKIGFIGMGNIGYAIMRSLLNKYKTEDITFYGSEPPESGTDRERDRCQGG